MISQNMFSSESGNKIGPGEVPVVCICNRHHLGVPTNVPSAVRFQAPESEPTGPSLNNQCREPLDNDSLASGAPPGPNAPARGESEKGEALARGGPGLPVTAGNAWGVLRLELEAKANEVGVVLTKKGFNAPQATSAELRSRE